MKRRSKIICTLGRQTNKFEPICDLLRNGMDIARINMATIQY